MDPTMIDAAPGGVGLLEDSSNEGSHHTDEEKGGGESSTGTNAGEGTTSDSSADYQIAQSETKAVKRSKTMVYIILGIFALATAAGVFFYVKNEEQNTFEDEFDVFAQELLDNADEKAKSIFRQLNTLAVALTSQAESNDQQNWPYVTLPHFYKRTEELGALSGAQAILFAPHVAKTNQTDWENAFALNQDSIIHDNFDPDISLTGTFRQEVHLVPESVYEADNVTLLDEEFFLPVVAFGPEAKSLDLLNINLKSHPVIQLTARDSFFVQHPLLSAASNFTFLTEHNDNQGTAEESPTSVIAEPIFPSFDENDPERDVVGFVFAVEPWVAYLDGALAADLKGIFEVEVRGTCGELMVFTINQGKVSYEGENRIPGTINSRAVERDFATFARYDGEYDGRRHCDFTMIVLPHESFREEFETSEPWLFAMVVFLVFLITVSFFAIYDWMVRRRQAKVLGLAKMTTTIVNSMFPKTVGARLLADAKEKAAEEEKKNRRGFGALNKKEQLNAFINDETKDTSSDATKKKMVDPFSSSPIAEFYTDTTIMFADIAGFTAWSSTREPKQVFQLLETIYHDFDTNAQRRKVFKVETVGDCYVAVAGLPQPRKDHAIVMARFARDCMYRFQILTQQLEVELGPDTADLSIRIGLHSGPVTAGVLRGERARFQLFGDTINTASRMESSSMPGKIQISEETAGLLHAGGKSHWTKERHDLAFIKGKGKLRTFWLDMKGEGPRSASSKNGTSDKSSERGDNTASNTSDAGKFVKTKELAKKEEATLRQKEERLIKWNTEILTKILIEIRARPTEKKKILSQKDMRALEQTVLEPNGKLVLDEVEDIITLPAYRSEKVDTPESEELDANIKEQLRDFVATIAKLYRNNPFHNFEHASHVTMSIVKLLSRVVAPPLETKDESEADRLLHDHSYGITSDPLTQFACCLSGLIHDVDHTGVPNTQLVKEGQQVAKAYMNKSVAEQNSVDLAWSLLMEDRYTDLRGAIYKTQAEFKRFRSLIVNSVMATDIMDKALGAQRKERWNAAFSESARGNESTASTVNRKATIVIEHLIQASDVAHTMQHWQIYQKWNRRLFQELYNAYKQGRAEQDPSEFWHKGEIGFLEFYIIPLAKKLKDCGVFGVSSDEYLNYALKNKQEWETKGLQIVEEFKEAAMLEYEATYEVVNEEAPEQDEEVVPSLLDEVKPSDESVETGASFEEAFQEEGSEIEEVAAL